MLVITDNLLAVKAKYGRQDAKYSNNKTIKHTDMRPRNEECVISRPNSAGSGGVEVKKPSLAHVLPSPSIFVKAA